jgi:hypothetical protein
VCPLKVQQQPQTQKPHYQQAEIQHQPRHEPAEVVNGDLAQIILVHVAFGIAFFVIAQPAVVLDFEVAFLVGLGLEDVLLTCFVCSDDLQGPLGQRSATFADVLSALPRERHFLTVLGQDGELVIYFCLADAQLVQGTITPFFIGGFFDAAIIEEGPESQKKGQGGAGGGGAPIDCLHRLAVNVALKKQSPRRQQ